MANRSYLYAVNVIPGSPTGDEKPQIIGLSEWSYDIPLVYKLLLSGQPQACPSVIWDMEGECALVGDYVTGLARLREFLSEISLPAAQGIIRETLNFLSAEANTKKYFLLEGTEIFCMSEGEPAEQNQALLEEILHINAQANPLLFDLQQRILEIPKPPGFFAHLFGPKPQPSEKEEALMLDIYSLGLGECSNVLYYSFDDKKN